MTDNRWLAGETFLKATEPVFGRLADKYGRCSILPLPPENYYSTLIKGIIAQQVASDVSQAIYASFARAFGPSPAPQTILTASKDSLLALGLTEAKIHYIKDLSLYIAEDKIDFKQLALSDDATVVKQLTQIKGLGRWTAELFLILALARPDVLPADDFGLKKSLKDNFNLPALPQKRQEITALAEPWRPWRSLAVWYLWQDFAAK